MTTASESKAALSLLTDTAVGTVAKLFSGISGSPKERRLLLLDAVPEIVSYYSDGSSALAADFYDDRREISAPPKLYIAEPVIEERTEKIRRAVVWAADPMLDDDPFATLDRLSGVVQLETARPYRDTILTNRNRDPSAVGWQRVTNGGCKMCRMLADRGAVYSDKTARFATHPNCRCSAQPVFSSDEYGREASVIQYVASRKRRTPSMRADLREYLNANY